MINDGIASLDTILDRSYAPRAPTGTRSYPTGPTHAGEWAPVHHFREAPSANADDSLQLPSEIVFDLAVQCAEFAILQIGVANEDVFIAGDHLLGRKQAGPGIDDVDA